MGWWHMFLSECWINCCGPGGATRTIAPPLYPPLGYSVYSYTYHSEIFKFCLATMEQGYNLCSLLAPLILEFRTQWPLARSAGPLRSKIPEQCDPLYCITVRFCLLEEGGGLHTIFGTKLAELSCDNNNTYVSSWYRMISFIFYGYVIQNLTLISLTIS